MRTVDEIVRDRSTDILSSWIKSLRRLIGDRAENDEIMRGLSTDAGLLLPALGKAMAAASYPQMIGPEYDAVRGIIAHISAARAKDGFTPTETAGFMSALKQAMSAFIEEELGNEPRRLAEEILRFGIAVDQLVLASFDAYVQTREEIIRRQSLAILEISTPALRLWDGLVLMPLVGVIDTARAQQVMETLLDAVAGHEAKVAILDVTGVPVIDSRVALHLTRTVTAVGMLGAQVIVTGISPDTAQTLVRLDVDLTMMFTRGTLRTGLKEGLRILDQRIGKVG